MRYAVTNWSYELLLLLVFFSITNFSASFDAIALVAGELPKRKKAQWSLHKKYSAENLVSKECNLLHEQICKCLCMHICVCGDLPPTTVCLLCWCGILERGIMVQSHNCISLCAATKSSAPLHTHSYRFMLYELYR